MGTSSTLKGIGVGLTSMLRKLWRMYRQTRKNQSTRSQVLTTVMTEIQVLRQWTRSLVYRYQRWEEFVTSNFRVVPWPQSVLSQEGQS